MKPSDRELDVLRLAERIADGGRVDWEREERENTGAGGRLRHLRVVERISQAHRELLTEDLPFPTWGPLDLRQPIARGGFGEIYLAHDRNLDRTVALKLLPADDDGVDETEFVEEARRLASVRHKNVVTIHGVDRHNGRSGLWMEWIDGESLDDVLDDRGPLGAREAALTGVELCRALAAVHAAGLVHRDVKLANVVRERGGRIVLMDFGSSTRRSADRSPDTLSGTLLYIAPEAFFGGDSGERMDYYALGVTLYRLSSGSFPLESGDVVELGRAHREEKLVPLRDRNPDLPGEFVRIVERAMHPDPEQRFGSAGEMERALAAFLGGSRAEETPRSSFRARFALGLAAVAAVVVLALATRGLLPGGFEADATFFRFSARGTEERLSDGVRIAPGDQLFLELRTSRRAWVYVINADAAGEQNLLFPVGGIEQTNPLPAGTHRIPGEIEGVEQGWDVTSAGGEESLLVVASTRALDVVEERITELRSVEPGAPLRFYDEEMTEWLRGIGGISAVPRTGGDGSAVDAIREGIALQSGDQRGVRIWELTLPNPG